MKKLKRPAMRGDMSARRKRHARDLWSAEVYRLKNGGKPNPRRLKPGKIVYAQVGAPKFFSLQRNNYYTQSIKFLHRIRDNSRKPGCGILIDCSEIEKIYPNAAVMLLAEIDRAIAGGRVGFVRLRRPRDPLVDAVLNQIKIYDRLNMVCNTRQSEHESVKHWNAATGVKSLGVAGGNMLEQYSGRLAVGLEKGLYEGIVEAMTNTVQHAYITQDGEALSHKIGKRWWLLSQEYEGNLMVAFCDLGIGIPRSLPHTRSFAPERVRALLSKLGVGRGDVGAIEVAIELGKTRTGDKGRGKGLSEIVDAVDRSAGGGVIIASNHGRYIAVVGEETLRENFSQSVRGTLIMWTVSVSGAAVSGGSDD